MRKQLSIATLAFSLALCCIASSDALAQTWSAEQQSVLKMYKAMDETRKKGEIEKVMGFFHDDFSGWGWSSPTPSDKDGRRRGISRSMATTDTEILNHTPLAIKIHGNVAVVHSYVSFLNKDKKTGDENVRHIRWTDVLLKKGDSWVLIADHGRLWVENCAEAD